MCNLLKKLFQKIRKGPPKLARFAISRKVWQHWSLVDSLGIRWLLSDQLKTLFLRESACADCFVNAGDFSILWTRELEKNQIDGVCAERQNIISTWTVEHKISFWKITFLTWLIAAFFNGIYFRSHNEPADQIFCTLKKNQSRWTGVPQTRALSSSKDILFDLFASSSFREEESTKPQSGRNDHLLFKCARPKKYMSPSIFYSLSIFRWGQPRVHDRNESVQRKREGDNVRKKRQSRELVENDIWRDIWRWFRSIILLHPRLFLTVPPVANNDAAFAVVAVLMVLLLLLLLLLFL